MKVVNNPKHSSDALCHVLADTYLLTVKKGAKCTLEHVWGRAIAIHKHLGMSSMKISVRRLMKSQRGSELWEKTHLPGNEVVY